MVRHMADRHQHKRAYQPQITSFFNTSDHTILPASTATHASLAPSVQSSLLSVGMRIRKAIPEGYKTHKTMPLSSISATRLNAAPTSSSSGTITGTQSENPQPLARARELQPFCGIHRVGGMSVQETMLDSMNGYGTRAFTDNFDNFASSQESNFSITGDEGVQAPSSFFSHPAKRSLDDDDEDEDEDAEDLADFFSESANSSNSSSRQFAKPRSRRKDAVASSAFAPFVEADFDDAPFLKPLDHQMDGV